MITETERSGDLQVASRRPGESLPSRNPPTDTPRLVFEEIFRQPVAQSSGQVKLIIQSPPLVNLAPMGISLNHTYWISRYKYKHTHILMTFIINDIN